MGLESAETLTIGVDLGGTSLRIAAWTPKVGVLDSITLPTRLNAGPIAVVEDMCRTIGDLLDRYGQYEAVGIGVGSPGPLELPAGKLHQPPNMPGWDGFPLLDEIRKRVQPPVYLEGDANVAVLAEYALGLGKDLGVDSLCMLTLGTGVGNGIVLNGQLWHGASGMGGEAGHMTIHVNGPRCGCGNRGCLEACASATALVKAAERKIASGTAPGLERFAHARGPLTALALAEAAHEGDADARALYDDVGRALGIALAGLVNILNVPLYVVGGGVSSSWDLLRGGLFDELERRSYVYTLTAPGGAAAPGMPGGGTRVLPAKLGPEAGLLGACLLPLFAQQGTVACSTLSS